METSATDVGAMDVRRNAAQAAERIRPYVRRTPVEPSPWLAGDSAARVVLKLENLQRTGSFKLRGAMSKLTSLTARERERGVVAASTGNHGRAVALGSAELGATAVVFCPETAKRSKVERIAELGAEVRFAGSDCLEAERAARAFAIEHGATYVSPYNDRAVVAGQGTLALELEEEVDRLDAVFVAVGGGGLISGVGGVLHSADRHVEIVACSPRSSAVMHASLEAGRVLDLPSEETLSDATAGGLEEGSITFELCQRTVDRFVLVDEDEIAAAVRVVVAQHHTLIEGAAGVAVAAFLGERERYAGRTVAIVLCGANIDLDDLRRLL